MQEAGLRRFCREETGLRRFSRDRWAQQRNTLALIRPTGCTNCGPSPREPVTIMPTLSTRIHVAVTILAALALSTPALSQPAPAPVRPAPARPAAAAQPRPVAVPGQQPARPVAAAPRGGAACHNGMSFDRFLADLKQQAVAEGVSPRALAEAAPYLVYDQSIVNRDRGQRVFGQVFTEFARNRASEGAAKNAQARIRMHAAAFNRAEKEYGVPPAVIAAFWGLESSFGAELGKLHTLPSLVSLAYDCRRSEMFQKETIAALKIVDRGDLTASEMIGSWAGELGQTQFLPTHYFNYAVDYDGDGHRDLLHSAPDVIGSTANYIANGLKWRRGEPWLQEVRAPQLLPWDQADLTIKLPRSKWAQLGVPYPDGKPLPNDDLPARGLPATTARRAAISVHWRCSWRSSRSRRARCSGDCDGRRRRNRPHS